MTGTRLLDLADASWRVGCRTSLHRHSRRSAGSGAAGGRLTLLVQQPNERLVDADHILPRPIAQQFLVAHGDHRSAARSQVRRIIAMTATGGS